MSWWTVVWVLLVLALFVVPIVSALWMLREAVRAGRRVSVALSQLVPDSVLESEDEMHRADSSVWVPGAAANNWQRAAWQTERCVLRRERVGRKVTRANAALRRWSRLGMFDTVSGSVEAQFAVRVAPRVGHG